MDKGFFILLMFILVGIVFLLSFVFPASQIYFIGAAGILFVVSCWMAIFGFASMIRNKMKQ